MQRLKVDSSILTGYKSGRREKDKILNMVLSLFQSARLESRDCEVRSSL